MVVSGITAISPSSSPGASQLEPPFSPLAQRSSQALLQKQPQDDLILSARSTTFIRSGEVHLADVVQLLERLPSGITNADDLARVSKANLTPAERTLLEYLVKNPTEFQRLAPPNIQAFQQQQQTQAQAQAQAQNDSGKKLQGALLEAQQSSGQSSLPSGRFSLVNAQSRPGLTNPFQSQTAINALPRPPVLSRQALIIQPGQTRAQLQAGLLVTQPATVALQSGVLVPSSVQNYRSVYQTATVALASSLALQQAALQAATPSLNAQAFRLYLAVIQAPGIIRPPLTEGFRKRTLLEDSEVSDTEGEVDEIDSLFGLVLRLFKPVSAQSEAVIHLSGDTLRAIYGRASGQDAQGQSHAELTREELLKLMPRNREEAYHLEWLTKQAVFDGLASLDGHGESLSLTDIETALYRHRFSYEDQEHHSILVAVD